VKTRMEVEKDGNKSGRERERSEKRRGGANE
jgi:hypothetical protein